MAKPPSPLFLSLSERAPGALGRRRQQKLLREMKMIGIAVLGAGRIGKIHAANAAANPKARLVAVADPIADVVNPVAKALGAEPVLDCVAAIERPDVDAVVIGTPTDTHVALLLKAVE